MPAAVMLPKATLFLDVLPKHHQGEPAQSASSHDAVKITIVKLGVVGCVEKGEAGAATIRGNSREGMCECGGLVRPGAIRSRYG